MTRDVPALARRDFDLLVAGAGVVGAAVARDAALRGLSVALVEAGDFAGGNSANSLKIVHGGLRHLQRLDLRSALEYVAERAAWLRVAPHLVRPLPVLLPATQLARPLLHGARIADRLLAALGDLRLPPETRLPPSRRVGAREAVRLAPELEEAAARGGLLVYDAQLYSPERLVLELVLDAARAGAAVANYASLEGVAIRDGRVVGARVRDRITGRDVDVRALTVVNAAGAGALPLAQRLTGAPPPDGSEPSVALNLVLRNAPQAAYALRSRGPGRERRRLFVVPWRGRTLVGTGHAPYGGDPAHFRMPADAVERFLAEVRAAWPGRGPLEDDLLLVQGGLLPAAPGRGPVHGRLVRRHRVLDHGAQGAAGLLTVVSVRFTTARRVAEQVVDRVFGRLGRKAPPCPTAEEPLPGGRPGGLAGDTASQRRDPPAVPPDREVLEHLFRSYGSGAHRVLALGAEIEGGYDRVEPEAPVVRAQLVHGARHEMAVRPEDLVWRRTELGPVGLATPGALRTAEEALRDAARTPAPPGPP